MTTTKLSPIERAIRNCMTVRWLQTGLANGLGDPTSPAAILPGTRDTTLRDLKLGYSSWLGCPPCEVDELYGSPEYLEWLWEGRFDEVITRWDDESL